MSAANDPGYGLAEGAIRVVQTAPKWGAEVKEGKPVRSNKTQAITFLIGEE